MSTITLTLEVPDDLAERLAAMDPERRQRFAVAAMESFQEEEDLSPGQRVKRRQHEEMRARSERFRQRAAERNALLDAEAETAA